MVNTGVQNGDRGIARPEFLVEQKCVQPEVGGGGMAEGRRDGGRLQQRTVRVSLFPLSFFFLLTGKFLVGPMPVFWKGRDAPATTFSKTTTEKTSPKTLVVVARQSSPLTSGSLWLPVASSDRWYVTARPADVSTSDIWRKQDPLEGREDLDLGKTDGEGFRRLNRISY